MVDRGKTNGVGWMYYTKLAFCLLIPIAITSIIVVHNSHVSTHHASLIHIIKQPLHFVSSRINEISSIVAHYNNDVNKSNHDMKSSPARTRERDLLKYQKCRYPTIDPFDPATWSYHNKPKKFTCTAKRLGIVRNEVLRVEVTKIASVVLYYIKREADSKSVLSKPITLFPADGASKVCLVDCTAKCASGCNATKYCCRVNAVCSQYADATKNNCTAKPSKRIFYRLNQEFLKLKVRSSLSPLYNIYCRFRFSHVSTIFTVLSTPKLIIVSTFFHIY